MCGIVGYVGSRNCTDVLINGLTKLEYRGYDSAGIAVFSESGNIQVAKSKGRLADLIHKMEQEGRPEGHAGIGHTRWATHGEPSDINSHPHTGGRVTIVHNGIIENYKELKEYLSAKGVTFASDTDTEVVARLLDYNYNGSPIETISNTIRDLEGSYALGIIFADHPDVVYATRKESPLIVGLGKEESFIASDVPAILRYTRDYYLLEQEEIAVLDHSGVKVYDAYGVEVQADYAVAIDKAWKLGLNGTFAWTPSINEGEPTSKADQSVGKQLPYIPEYSATLSGRLTYRSWGLLYKWCYYSERYTMTSNAVSYTGHLPPYLMSNVTLEKGFSLRWADLSLKGTVNNLFDEEYLSVLSRPMPGINFEFFIGITPKWGKKKK